MKTDIEAMDIKAGPRGAGSFSLNATVRCEYVEKNWPGHSLKFGCDLGQDDLVKVKIGESNGEVYGEVAATRLLWALGFGADRMYPVRVVCRGCPNWLGGTETEADERLFAPAVIERPMPGAEFDDDPGWSWVELDRLDETGGGATTAERDALKLLAVLIQHTDTKTEQQRLICVDEPAAKHPTRCARPFLLLDDVGLTFGRANVLNNNAIGGVNFQGWSHTSVWKGEQGCVGNLPRSFTGTLNNPAISEDGRRFLSELLARLSDTQIRDLFEVSGFDRRTVSFMRGAASTDDWVQAFKLKRDEISIRRCV